VNLYAETKKRSIPKSAKSENKINNRKNFTFHATTAAAATTSSASYALSPTNKPGEKES